MCVLNDMRHDVCTCMCAYLSMFCLVWFVGCVYAVCVCVFGFVHIEIKGQKSKLKQEKQNKNWASVYVCVRES